MTAPTIIASQQNNQLAIQTCQCRPAWKAVFFAGQPSPIENPRTDPDVIEPGEPNPARTPMWVRGAK